MASSSNSSRNEIQQTEDFKRLKKATEVDEQIVNSKLDPLSKQIFNETVSIDDRIRILGEAVSCTLLAYDHRGGYPNNKNGHQKLAEEFMIDFGFDIREYVKFLGLSSFKQFLESEHMLNYVQYGMNSNNEYIIKGRPFQNDLLGELLEEQKIGQEGVDRKKLNKDIEKKARMDAANLNPESIEGRLRIYKCVHLLGNGTKWVSYQNVQTEYKTAYKIALDKAEIKRLFGESQAIKALQECTKEDLLLQQNKETQIYYMKLRQPLEEIQARYNKLLEELKNLPDSESIAKMRKAPEGRRFPIKPKKTAIEPNFVEETGGVNVRSALYADWDNLVQQSSHNQPGSSSSQSPAMSTKKQAVISSIVKDSAYTNMGEGRYSSDDSEGASNDEGTNGSNDEVSVPQPSVSTTTAIARSLKIRSKKVSRSNSDDSDDEKVVRVSPRHKTLNSSAKKDTSQRNASFTNGIQSSSVQRNASSTNGIQSSSVQRNASSTNEISIAEVSNMILKAFIYGVLKTSYPLQVPISSIIKKAESYMASQNMKMSRTQIDQFIHNNLNGEVQFHSGELFVTLAKVRKQ